MRIEVKVTGPPETGTVAQVANHSSWLDILVLNSVQQVSFVSKAEVANWPVIGAMAKSAGTLFITRNRRDVDRQRALIENRLRLGGRLLVFPEGTSTDGQRVLPFKPTLFAAFLAPELRDDLCVQSIALNYYPPAGCSSRFFGWWGDMEFGAHMLQVLAHGAGGAVTVHFAPSVKVSDFGDRKELALACETTVRDAFNEAVR